LHYTEPRVTLPIYRLRRWLAATAVVFTLVVAGMYLYARLRERNVTKSIGKMGIEIKQTATGFQFSKSDAGRTLFTVQASSLKQFRLDGRAELHNVSIVLYGRDSSRFDQIYGDNFTYDQKSGDVTANGDVQIDLEPNPSGATAPDQATPKELKNPIHLKTRDLVFNNKTGDAATDARVDFQTPQAAGSAVGVRYAGKTNTLVLLSQVHVVVKDRSSSIIDAASGNMNSQSHQVVLNQATLRQGQLIVQTNEATFFLGEDNSVQRVLAVGNVTAQTAEGRPGNSAKAEQALHARADEGELLLEGKQNRLRTANLTGNVEVERGGDQPVHGNAGRAVLDFVGQNELRKIHAMDGVRLTQKAANTSSSPKRSSRPQDFELTAPVVDFYMTNTRALDRAVTTGNAQIVISPAQADEKAKDVKAKADHAPAPLSASPSERTVVTAGKFTAKFEQTPEGQSRITSMHGAPDARIVSVSPEQPDRVSASDNLDAAFLPEGGIGSITQQGHMTYTDGLDAAHRTQAWADLAHYTPVDQILLLTGKPRVDNGGMETTAQTVRIDRATGDGFADGDVKTTYSELKEKPNGALLASSSPIHVTAQSMTSHQNTGTALYTGNARLWQDANVIQAPSIEFDRDHRSVLAQGTPVHPVSTILVQNQKNDPAPGSQTANPPASTSQAAGSGKASARRTSKSTPVAITSSRLTYADGERKAHYEGGVIAKGVDFTCTSKTMDAYLLPRQPGPASNAQPTANQSPAVISTGPGQLDHMVAQGDVVVQQPNRRALGQTLTYTAADNKFVLTGGTPSIFDAERGKITGVSLTFFRADDRVLVEGEASTPVVTQTRVTH
jgi:lipopolysaccharide export system protein LptA